MGGKEEAHTSLYQSSQPEHANAISTFNTTANDISRATSLASKEVSNVRRSSRFSVSTSAIDLATPSISNKGKKRVSINENTLPSSHTNPQVLPPAFNPPSGTGREHNDRKGKKRANHSSTSPPAALPPAKRSRRSTISSSNLGKRYDLRGRSEGFIEGFGATSRKSQGESNRHNKEMPSKFSSRQKGHGSSTDRHKKGDSAAAQLINDDYMDEDDSMWEEQLEDRNNDDEDEDDEDEDDEGGEDDAEEDSRSVGRLFGFGGNTYDRLARLASESGVNLDDATAALFGTGFRAFGNPMSGMSNRLKRLKKKLHSKNNATRLAALKECSELLLVSNEETLGGVFSPTSFATEFIAILKGEPNIEEGESDEEESVFDDMDEDAQLAAALALSSGETANGMDSEDEMECQLVACRCLAHLMEALPGCGHSLVQLGAVPVLCSKLTEISYIELAEQTLSTLEKISAEYPSAIVREGGLGALLSYLPFFSTNVQRTAVTAAANCCRNISSDCYLKIKEVFPILHDTLGSGDPRLVEQATLAILRTIESFRHNAGHLEGLLDATTVTAINALLLPSGGSPLITPSTYTHLLKALTTSARGSAKVSIRLLESGMINTAYHILTGVLPPTHDEDEQGMSIGGQGLAGGVADMAVLQNLAHRPKEQVEESLALIVELLPPIPKDGVFDSKAYSEKNLYRVRKGRRIEGSIDKPRRSSRVAEASTSNNPYTGIDTPPDAGTSSQHPSIDVVLNISANREAAAQRAKKEAEAQTLTHLGLCRANTDLICKFIKTVVPVLVDVYAASVVPRVRTKVLVGLVKAIAFAPNEPLRATLKCVPMASFLCAIISSKDNEAFVLHALQIVELLATKLPEIYQVSFLREGVVFEIATLARQEMNKEKNAKETAAKVEKEESIGVAPLKQAMESVPLARPEVLAPPTPSSMPVGSTTATSLPIPDELRSLLFSSGLSAPMNLSAGSGQSTPRKHNAHPDPHDSNIVRARMLFAKKIFELGGENQQAATKIMSDIKALVKRLCQSDATEADLRKTLRQIAEQFSHANHGLSSFELLQSGLVDGILEFVDISGEVSSTDRRAMLFEVFSDTSISIPNPLTILVKRLHESLGRLENFEVETAFDGGFDPMRPSSSGIHRTLRIRLVADEGGENIPKAVSQLVITVQAIASIKTIHEYLRPKIANGNSHSELSQMFAAYAAGRSDGGGGGVNSSTARFLNTLTGGSSRGLDNDINDKSPVGNRSIASSGSMLPGNDVEPSLSFKKPQRRRSARLNPSADPPTVPTAGTSVSASESIAILRAPPPSIAVNPVSSSAPSDGRISVLPPPSSSLGMETGIDMDFDEDEDFSEDEFDAPMIDQLMQDGLGASGPSDTVVNMDVTADGSRVEAKTPQGTRIATPSQNTPANGVHTSASDSRGPSRQSSYAGALRAPPADWHLEFFLNGEKLSMEDTIYGALYRGKHATSGISSSDFLVTPTINFRKVDGPPPVKAANDEVSPASVKSALPATCEPSSPTSKILRLLRVVHNLSIEGREILGDTTGSLDENLFVNNKLTAKLTRQLEEILIIASNCLPRWAIDLPKHFSFLFPFDTRYNFLSLTSFGFPRLLLKAQQSSSRQRDDMPNIANLLRRKVRISRTQLLESCAKVMEMYATFPGSLEVEYFDEIGTGLGPTLEFYALASKEFARRNLKIWRDEDSSVPGNYVHHLHGLFPCPLPIASAEANAARLKWYKTLGLFIGRSMLDSRIIDINLNQVFFKLILNKPVKKNIATLRTVDPQLARSLERLQTYLWARKEIEALPLPTSSRRAKLAALRISGAKLADLALDFTLPGYSIDLKSGGAHLEVDDSNLEDYLEKVLDSTLGSGVAQQVQAFQDGFSAIFNIKNMEIFSLQELRLLFGNAEEDWSRETLEQSIKADHGYNQESRAVQNLIEVMSSYNMEQRRQFLQFMTGAPKLPIGGFRGLTPPFTVVRKPHEPPYKADDYLPSVMTCALYLKMPDYSSREILAAQFERAMKDGKGSFLLS
ncbi:hypothetical protein L204_100280 [Cryptococcus depauperatus]|nr:E3 ubiquitin-protein ligase TRIP12 [Cryptococcus depauperatus CBS 7855]